MQLEDPPRDLAFCRLMENIRSFHNHSVIDFGVGFELNAPIGAALGEMAMGMATVRGRRARAPIRSAERPDGPSPARTFTQPISGRPQPRVEGFDSCGQDSFRAWPAGGKGGAL